MMDIKNLKLKVTRSQRNKFFLQLFQKRRLFFLCLLGVAMVYAFNLLYNKAYIEINYIEYPTDVESISVRKESAALGAIMKKVEQRRQNLELLAEKTYVDPFNFKKEVVAEKTEGQVSPVASTQEEDAAARVKPPVAF